MERIQIGNATLYHGDSIELKEHLQGDALISDPPYGINLQKLTGSYSPRSNWDKCRVRSKRPEDYYSIAGDDKPFDPVPWIEYPKVILWGGIHFPGDLPGSRAWLVWDKREGGKSDNQADCEIAWSNLPGPARLHSHLWRGMCRRGEENVSLDRRYHPTQKPINLMMWCIELCKLDPKSIIVDPFMGSGTTGIAAVRLGHKFIGCEIDKSHFDTACERLEREQTQINIQWGGG